MGLTSGVRLNRTTIGEEKIPYTARILFLHVRVLTAATFRYLSLGVLEGVPLLEMTQNFYTGQRSKIHTVGRWSCVRVSVVQVFRLVI